MKRFYSDGSIWVNPHKQTRIEVIDQRYLPFKFEMVPLESLEDVHYAIREMVIRGAPLIGVTAAFGMYLALARNRETDFYPVLEKSAVLLESSRPTAVNLFMATRRMLAATDREKSPDENIRLLFDEACRLRQEEIDSCRMIGEFGLSLIEEIWRKKEGQPVQILTHCNAGWLACVKWGTATAPLYLAHEKGIPLHVWVDETRPRNQGSRLTAWEMGVAGIPHTVIVDNAGGHLMQHGMVDLVITGSDRTTVDGDVANKTGTYLKALSARDNHIPFYVALPSSSIDWHLEDGVRNIPVEERSPDEVTFIEGWDGSRLIRVRLLPGGSSAVNFGFDVTPARLVTGLITERGICRASREGILSLFPDKSDKQTTQYD